MRFSLFCKLVVLVWCCGPMSNAWAQQDSSALKYTYVNAKELSVLGQARNVQDQGFHRIDEAQRKNLPKAVANLATNSAGISVTFKTNSKSIKLKWTLAKFNTLYNMTPLAVNGLDLYGWNGKTWQYVGAAKPTAVQNEELVIGNLDGALRHYRVYLPLYASAQEVHVGVDAGAVLEKAEASFLPAKKVVIYGSSITQGASASRPGMAYPAQIERHLNVETINLGFSGSGKMELELAEVLGKMDADVYVLDCVPNPTPEQIKARAVPFIKRLRQLKPNTPILMVESIFRESAYWDQQKNQTVTRQNQEFRNAYEQLKQEKMGQLYYLPSKDLIGHDHEATIDGTHLTDLGFARLATQVEKQLKKILPRR